MKKADHEHIVGQLSSAHEMQLREVRSKHKREVHKLQQELKNASTEASIDEQNKVNAQRRELITAATTAATKTACTETAKIVKEEYKKKMMEMEEKQKREISELQEKLAKVTLERDKARTAISDMVNLGTESLSSNLSTSTNQGASGDGDSLSSVEEVVVSLEDLQRNFPEARDFIAFAKSLYPTLKSITYGTSVNLNSFLPSHTLLTYLLLLLLVRPAKVFSDV